MEKEKVEKIKEQATRAAKIERGNKVISGINCSVVFYNEHGVVLGGVREETYLANKDEVEALIKAGKEEKERRDAEEAKRAAEEEKRNRIQIHIVHRDLNLFTLSHRVSPSDWSKIKNYLCFVNASEEDEDYLESFRGWAIKPPYRENIAKVEELLNIAPDMRLQFREEQSQQQREAEKEKEQKLNQQINEIKKAFENAEKPSGINIVEGEVIDNPLDPPNIYGGGEWWVIDEPYIWQILNNGMDGDNWSLNNVKTVGAGAIGVRVPFTTALAEKIRSLQNEGKNRKEA